jgi:hypothetical protein
MARTKSDPKIIRSIRGPNGRLFKAGDEAELSKTITADQITHLTRAGSITGSWSPAPTSKAKAAAGARTRGATEPTERPAGTAAEPTDPPVEEPVNADGEPIED